MVRQFIELAFMDVLIQHANLLIQALRNNWMPDVPDPRMYIEEGCLIIQSPLKWLSLDRQMQSLKFIKSRSGLNGTRGV
jgi:hypothetical protein